MEQDAKKFKYVKNAVNFQVILIYLFFVILKIDTLVNNITIVVISKLLIWNITVTLQKGL